MSSKLFPKRLIVILLFVFTVGLLAVWRFGAKSEANSAMLPPTLVVNETVTPTTDLGGNGATIVNPGDTLAYTVTIQNTGADATGVMLSDTLSSITTLSGSANIVPIARNDAYQAIGNVNLVIPAANSLLANDSEFDGGTLVITGIGNSSGTANGTAPNVDLTTTSGGTLKVQTNGTFTYNPARGLNTGDTFFYTVSDGQGGMATASATVTVGGMIWFVNPAAAVDGDGRLLTPYKNLPTFQTANALAGGANPDNGDAIFLYSGAHTAPLTLRASQILIGQGASASILSITGITAATGTSQLPATGGANPTLTSSGVGITLSTGNTIRGLTVGSVGTSAGNAKIFGSGFGNLTLGNTTSPDVTLNGAGGALNLTNGNFVATSQLSSLTTTSSVAQGVVLSNVTGTAAFGSTTVSGAATQGILIGTSTANLNFGNTSVTATTDGISFQNNSGGTKTFGTLSTTNGSGVGFLHAVGGGAVTVTGAATFTNPGGRCIDIQNDTTAITFQGTTTATQCGGTGVFLSTNSGNVTFAQLNISPDANIRAFQATNNTGTITTTSGTIPSTGTATAVEITNASGTVPLNMTLTSVTASGGANGIFLQNTSGTGFSVVGDGTNTSKGGNSSGGTISNMNGGDATTAGIGVYMNNASNVSLRRMTINGTIQNNGIYGQAVNNFTLQYATVGGTIGTSSGSNDLNRECPIQFGQTAPNNVDAFAGGSVSTIDNVLVSGGIQHNLEIYEFANTSSITISNSNITNNSAALGSDGINVETQTDGNAGTPFAQLTVNVNNCLFNNNKSQAFQASALGDSFLDVTANQNTIQKTTQGNEGFIFQNASDADMTAHITNNTFTGILGTNILVGQVANNATANSNLIAVIKNNTSTIGAVGGPYPTNRTLIVFFSSTVGSVSTANVLVEGNTINTQSDPVNGIAEPLFVSTPDANTDPSFTATVLNNVVNINDPSGTSLRGIAVQSTQNVSAGCIDVRGNDVNYTPTAPAGINGIRVRQVTPATLQMEQGASAGAANTVLAANNPLSTTEVSGTVTVVGNSTCQNAPSFAEPIGEVENKTVNSYANSLSFLNTSYQTPSEMVVTLEPLFKRSADAETISAEETIAADKPTSKDFPAIGEATAPGYLTSIAVFVGDASSLASEFVGKLDSVIAPTAYAQKSKLPKAETIAPESGEAITKGPFTLLAGETVTIKFNATVDNGPFAAGVNSITNQANVTANGGINVNSNVASILLDAAPDLSVTPSDGATTTQPGGIVVYTLSYANTSAANNLQGATGVTLTETVPPNTTFNAAASLPDVWSCADGSAAGTSCTLTIGALNANANGTRKFAVKVLDALPATAVQVSDTATIADDGANGADLSAPNNTGNDTTNIIGVWLGTTSTDWNTATNWSNGVVPPSGNNVSIPSGGGANSPSIVGSDVTLNNLVLNGKSITVNVNRTLTVSGATTLGSNLVDGAGTLALGSAATAISRTTGQVQSILTKTFAANGAFVYPVGTTGAYSPVNVNVTAGTGDLSVQAKTGVAPAVPPLDTTRTLHRFWTLNGSGITADVTFNYLDADVFGTESNYKIIRVSGGTAVSSPNQTPCPGVGSPCVNPALNTIFIRGLNSFSDWTAGELAPLAASAAVSGRIADANNRGLRKVTVMLIGGGLTEPRYALTDWFGRYTFEDVPVGADYIITPQSNRYRFEPSSRLQSLNEDASEINFFGSLQSP